MNPIAINKPKYFRTKRQSGSEVLYAAGWIVGEFSNLLTSPEETLQSLLRGMVPSLPSHIQSVYIQEPFLFLA